MVVELLKGDSKKNMKYMYTTSDIITCWEDINFIKAERYVKKLQKRIAVAYQRGELDKVEYLQNRLIHSFYAKALSVKIVSSNKGRNTPGIDNRIWNTSVERFKAINLLNRRKYTSGPLRRIYIPKSNGELRPLSIPCMKDRAMQTLYKLSIESIAEISADEHSFAYRKNKCAKDAVIYCCELLNKFPKFEWILKIDIEKCFEEICHEWILDNIPMDKKILSAFLKCGYIEKNVYMQTTKGVPQGGTISSVICNMTLDGIEERLTEISGDDVKFIRYADDMLILGTDSSLLLQIVLPMIEEFLHSRGLQISSKKTIVKHVKEGVNFLGYRIASLEHRAVATPMRRNIDSLLCKIKNVMDMSSYLSYKEQCRKLKLIIRGWLYYYSVADIQSLNEVEFEVMMLIGQLVGRDAIANYVSHLFDKYTNIFERSKSCH